MNTKYKIKPNQLDALRGLLANVTSDKGGALYVCSRLLDRSLRTLAEVSQQEWRDICDQAYPDWKVKDWTVSAEFEARLVHLHNEYQEMNGQRRLW